MYINDNRVFRNILISFTQIDEAIPFSSRPPGDLPLLTAYINNNILPPNGINAIYSPVAQESRAGTQPLWINAQQSAKLCFSTWHRVKNFQSPPLKNF